MLNLKTYHNSANSVRSCWNYWLLTSFFIISTTITVYAQAPVISYITPQTYIINTPIIPLSPQNTGGAVPATIYGQVSTYVGRAAGIGTITGVAGDAVGNIYVDDYDNSRIVKIVPSGVVTTLAGNYSVGLINGQGSAASFNHPDGLISDATGNLYVGDYDNNVIRTITPTGLVSTFAGSSNGASGSADGTGTAASFNNPRGLALDPSGNLYVADEVNNLIRKINPGGIATTIAGSFPSGFINGTGTAAKFNVPTGVGLDAAGNLYVADDGNSAIRKITPAGMVTTFASGLNEPREVRVDGAGNLYVTVQGGNAVDRISPTGQITTIAGSGSAGFTDGNGSSATFNGPIGLYLDGKGNLFVGDSENSAVRKIIITGYTIDKALPPGLQFDPTTGVISGTPTVSSQATNYTITAYNGSGSSVTVVNIRVLASSVTLKPSIITVPNSNNLPNIDQNGNFNPGATSTNTETPITYTSSDTNIAIINPDGTVRLLGPGTVTITANQAGDANYSPAVPKTITYIITEFQEITFPAIAPKAICDADFSVNASSSSDSNIPLTYTSSNPAVATISATGIIHITAAGTTTITVSQAGNTLYDAAQPQSQVLTVLSPSPPNVVITADGQSTCVGIPINFTAVVTDMPAQANPSYQWQVNGVNTGSNSPTFTSTILDATSAVQCMVTYGAVCGPLTGTSNIITGLLITPFTTPSVLISSSQRAPVCSGSTITFTASPVNEGTAPNYQWQVNGQNSGSNSPTFSANNFADGDIVSCVLTNTGGKCLTALTANSNVIPVSIIAPQSPGPAVSIVSSANGVYFGVPITFTATTANAGNAIDYQWQVNGNNAGRNSPAFTSSSLNNNDVVTCIIFISTGCIPVIASNGITANILPPPAVTVINTFTPNGDGINDLWDIPDLSFYPNCLVSVYTRYGALVFQSRGYPTAWDGSYKGKSLPAGTYYYVINLGNNTAKLSGFVAIIK